MLWQRCAHSLEINKFWLEMLVLTDENKHQMSWLLFKYLHFCRLETLSLKIKKKYPVVSRLASDNEVINMYYEHDVTRLARTSVWFCLLFAEFNIFSRRLSWNSLSNTSADFLDMNMLFARNKRWRAYFAERAGNNLHLHRFLRISLKVQLAKVF